jgi:cellulose synthase/poly-beta-1,6-N-acetylglucosamine synthase-like glycosyltransferase
MLGGTGFAIDGKLVREIGWGSFSLAEDTEFTVQLALRDVKIGYAKDAIVYNEHPVKFQTSLRQRVRWSQGVSDTALRLLRPLLRKSVKERNFSALHAFLTFFNTSAYPVLFGFLSIIDVFSWLEILGVMSPRFTNIWLMPANFLALNAFILGNFIMVFYGLYEDKKIDKRTIPGILAYIIYIITSIPTVIIGIFKRNQKEWFHTPHGAKEKVDILKSKK